MFKKRELMSFIVIFGFSAQNSTRNNYFQERKRKFWNFVDLWSAMPSTVNIRAHHEKLGQSGFSRMYCFIRSRNLPCTNEDTKNVINNCRTCAEVKPRFFKPAPSSLINATHPWERLSVDYEGSVRGPKLYLFVAIDEHSQFPFAFAWSSVGTKTVIDCLNNLCSDMKACFAERGIASSRSTLYHST